MSRLPLLSIVLAGLALGPVGCTKQRSRFADLAGRGYQRIEVLQDTIRSIDAAGTGVWDIGLGTSTRVFRVAEELSPDAARLVARARVLRANRRPCLITIAVHDDAPRTKLAVDAGATAADAVRGEAAAAPGVAAPHPWVVVALESELPVGESGR